MIDNTVQARAVPDDVADEIEELLGLIFQAARYERPSTDARPALEAFYRRHSASTSASDVPEYNGWYCAQCQCGVDGSDVTFHEQHTVCGRRITNDRPPVLAAAPSATAPVVEPGAQAGREAEDSARLDWLDRSRWYVGPEYDSDEAGGIHGYDNHTGNLREAIDAARATQGGRI